MADVFPIFKKENEVFTKENCRPVSILPHMPKVSFIKDPKRILHKQTNTKLSPFLVLEKIITLNIRKIAEAWKKHLDKRGKIEVILMSVSKALTQQILAGHLQSYMRAIFLEQF